MIGIGARHKIQPVFSNNRPKRCVSPAKPHRTVCTPVMTPQKGKQPKPELKLGSVRAKLTDGYSTPEVRASPQKKGKQPASLNKRLTPMRSFRGTLRSKVTSSLKKQVMKGMQDYGKLSGCTGDMQYIQFLLALEAEDNKDMVSFHIFVLP